MAECGNSLELAESPEEAILELQADLNLRIEDWTVLNEESNEVQEEICEEIIVEQESENCFDISADCIEESIVYVIEEPALEFDFSNSQYVIQEHESYDLNLTESTNAMISNSCQGEENTVQETSVVEDSVYNVINSDRSLKTCSLSDTIDDAVGMISLPPENSSISPSVLSPVLKTPTTVSSTENESSPNEKTIEESSPKTDISSPRLKTFVLGKEQIKKRLQSFSLMKQGIQPIPLKKIISPKQPKVQVQIGEVYDETGRKTDEKVLIKKPPKQGPSPQDKARAVIDEIEQIKREEAAIYEQNLTFMTHSLRDAHKKKTKLKMHEKLRHSKKYERNRSRSREKRRSPEVDKFEKKRREKSPEKEKIKDEDMPQNWTEIKQKDFSFEKIKRIKERILKFSEDPRSSPNRIDKKDRKKFHEDEQNFVKAEFIKPQLMFEYPSLLRHPIVALSVQGKTKLYPREIIRYTEKHPSISFSENPRKTSNIYKTRSQILNEIPEDRAEIMLKIINNKIGKTSFCKYISGTWYEKEYLTESKLELESEPVISYGLSVLSEMYNDEQEENPDKMDIKNRDTTQVQENIKNLNKIRKSKSRSRSKSKENNKLKRNYIEIDNKKVDKSKIPKSPVEEKEEKIQSEDKTPNTDEYRSNWESDEDFLSEIMPKNNRSDYNKSYRRSNSSDKKWESDEEYNKYKDRKKYSNKDTKKHKNNSSERDDRNKKHQDEDKKKHEKSLDREDKSSKEHRRHSKQNYIKNQEHEPRHSSINFRKSEEKYTSKKSSAKRQNEDRASSAQKSEEIDCRKNREPRHKSKEKASERNRNRKSSESSKHEEDKKQKEEKWRSSYESENRKSQDSERNHNRKTSEYSKHEEDKKQKEEKSRSSYESENRKSQDSERNQNRKSSESSKHEENKKQKEEKSRSSYESENRKSRDSERNRNRKSSEYSKHEEDKKQKEEKSRSSYESENRKSQDSERKKSNKECEDKKTEEKYSKLVNRNKKLKDRSESLEKYRNSSERNQRKYSTSRHEIEESNQNVSKREKEDEKKNNNRKVSKHEFIDNVCHSVHSEKADRPLPKIELEKKNQNLTNIEEKSCFSKEKSEEIERHSKHEIEEKNRLSSKIVKKTPEEDKPKSNPKNFTDTEERSQPSSERDSKRCQEKKIEDKRRNLFQNVTYNNKWSSEEDIHKIVTTKNDKNKVEKMSKNVEEFSTIQLNLGPNYRKSNWSSDEEGQNQSSRHEDVNFLKKEKFVKKRKTRWGSPAQNAVIYQNNEEIFEINQNDLLNITKDFNKKRKKSKDKPIENYSRKNKKKSKSERKKIRSTEKEKHKKNKKKDKKEKKIKDKPKVKITYSDMEENLDDEFLPEKEKEITIFNSNRYTPKIKIDYSDFDMSLMECKDKYEKKFDNIFEKTPEKVSQNAEILQSPYTPKIERKVNIDISDMLVEQNTSVIKKPEIDKPSEIIIETSTEDDQKSSKSGSENQEIIPNIPLPHTSKNDTNKYQEKLTVSVKIPPEVTPVAPPVLSIPITDSVAPITPDPTGKLASEYEEFIKAVCFEETAPATTTEIVEGPDVKDTDIEEDKSSDESSSEYESSESEESESVNSDIVTKIKTEKLTDSETESVKESKSEKRKRVESSSETEMNENIVVKTEKESLKKLKKSEEIKTFESESKYNNIIDWETTCIENTGINLYQNYDPKYFPDLTYPIIDISEIVAPENIPLPCEETLNVQNIPIPNTDIESPSDVISISSESPSPAKKTRSFIPIKLLTVESRKQANETTKLTVDEKEEKIVTVVSSTNVNLSNLEVTESVEETEHNSSRKRQSQWNLNISPAKKPLLQASSIAEDSDEDFTDKFIKQSDKKLETPKKTEDLKPQEKTEQKNDKKHVSKSENDSRKSKGEPELEKSHRKEETPRLEPRKKDRSPTPSKSNKDRNSRKSSREKIDRKSSPDRKRERSRDRREAQRDRDKRRQSDRRQPDRKPNFTRGRSPRPRYSSRERELPRTRPSEKSKERESKDKTRERDRSKDIGKRSYRRHSRSPSPNRKDYKHSLENIQVPHRLDDTDFSTTSMDIAHSPPNSPLDGFKRSLADSTISDSDLITQLNTPDESSEPSPGYLQQYYPQLQEVPPENRQSPSSPKRISLDDRINLVLGIEKDPPKRIDTVCTRGPFTSNPPNYDPYGYGRTDYDLYNPQQTEGYAVPQYSSQYQTPYYQNPVNTENNVKVVQVGNVIQVVPTEQPIVPPPAQVVKPIEVPPKVVQVGNMLQIVPMTIIDSAPAASSPLTTIAPSNPSVMIVEKPIIPKATDQLVLERRAEKEKRRLEREQRRKEKEKKRKEKEKRRQLKIKTKTENMIKRALMLETGEGDLDSCNVDAELESETNDNNLPLAWPPASVLTTASLPKPPGKGILISFREREESLCDDSMETRKIVKFADGICPGEGTSPSAGEDLPSPPPPPRKLPKEKRYKKVKNKNKKKIKVKIIRTLQPTIDEEESSEDNLPPPPPPPGSPPIHLWPPRIKQPPINNIHPSLPGSVFPHPHPPTSYPPPQQVIYPPTFSSHPTTGQVVPVVMGHAPPPPPPQNPRQHHPPVLPVVQPGVPQSTPHHATLHSQSSFHH